MRLIAVMLAILAINGGCQPSGQPKGKPPVIARVWIGTQEQPLDIVEIRSGREGTIIFKTEDGHWTSANVFTIRWSGEPVDF